MAKSYENYMLISDLDGTIVPHGRAISAANAEAIRAFVAGGGLFGIATGRTPEAAGGYVRGLPITTPSIFFNGSMLYDWQERKVLARRPLQGAEDSSNIWPRFAAECLKMFPQACVEVYTEEACCIVSPEEKDDPRLVREFYRCRHAALADVSDMQRTPWLKLLVCDAPPALHRVERLAKNFGTARLSHHFYSEANYYEFVAQGVSKGAMIEEIRGLPICQGRRIIALGDYLNDREMIELADIGIASGNAHESIKQAADFTGCRAEDDLVVWLLAHFAEVTAQKSAD